MNLLCSFGVHDYKHSYIGDVEVKTCLKCGKKVFDSRYTEWKVIDTRENLFTIFLIKQRTNIISGVIEVEEEVYVQTSINVDDIYAVRKAYGLPPISTKIESVVPNSIQINK